jgi:hypothetical protein
MAHEMAESGHKVYLIGSASHHLLRRKPVCDGHFELELTDGFTFVLVKMPSYTHAHSKVRVLNWLLFPWSLRKLPLIIDDNLDSILVSSPSLKPFLGGQWLARKFGSRLVFEVRDIWPLTLTEFGVFSIYYPIIRLMQWVEDRVHRIQPVGSGNFKFKEFN